MMEKGKLSNLSKVMGQGGFYKLTSTIPPQSPTAWSSFATCKNPGQHGIYDFSS
jgi:predicted AlkP superfamily phosphohydrolase/phosphomutase